MNAPGPPPTMPRRSRRCWLCFFDSPGMFAFLPRRESQHSAVCFLVRAGFCKIIECALCRLNDVPRNKRRAFPRSLLAALQAALPLENRPSVEPVLRQLGKNAAKIYLAVAQRAEAPRALHPRLVSAINALAARWAELRVLHVKHFDSRVINVEKCEVIELLQNKVAGIEQNVAPFVSAHAVQKHIKSNAIVKIFPWMQFETHINTHPVKRV